MRNNNVCQCLPVFQLTIETIISCRKINYEDKACTESFQSFINIKDNEHSTDYKALLLLLISRGHCVIKLDITIPFDDSSDELQTKELMPNEFGLKYLCQSSHRIVL